LVVVVVIVRSTSKTSVSIENRSNGRLVSSTQQPDTGAEARTAQKQSAGGGVIIVAN